MEIDRPGLEFAVNSYTPGEGLVWQRLFPLRFTPRFDIKGIEGNEGIPVSANRVAFNSRAPKKSRQKIGSWNGKLGKIAVSRSKDELEINEYKDLQTIAASSNDPGTANYLIDLVYDDVDFCNKAMDYKVEIDALRIACSGKATYKREIDGDLVTDDEIDFNIPEKNFKGVKVAWSNADEADALKDIADAQDAIAKQGLPKPMYCYMEKAKWEEICAQKATARRLFPRYEQSMVTADMITNESVNSYMSGKGYPRIIVLDTYASVEDEKGKITTFKPWDVDIVVLSRTENLGYTYHKTVPDVENTEALQTHGAYYKMTRYSEVNPMEETTMAEAYVQCALTNRRSLVLINTTKTTW